MRQPIPTHPTDDGASYRLLAPRTGSRQAHVTSELGRRIVSRRYAAGKTLPPQAQLLAEFGVSRPVLREAIKSLESKGMLEARQRRGTAVTPRNQWNLLDADVLGWIAESRADPEMLIRLNEVRQIIEPGACRLAAQRATPLQTERIEEAWLRMVTYVHDVPQFVEADRDFHLALLAASRNEYLAAIGTAISAALTVSLQTTNPTAASNRKALGDHERILAAIQAREPNEAAQASTAQIAESLRRLRRRSTPR